MSTAESSLVEADVSSLITQLFNDKFIKDLACVMALDENIVGMAEKLLEGAFSEHGTNLDDLDAWQYFTSLLKWQNNDKLMQKYPTKMGPKQQHLNQQIQETKARIGDEPSFKPLFAEKEHNRVVLVLVILFWSRDVCGLEDGIDILAGLSFEDDELDMGCCAYNKSFDFDSYHMGLPSEKEEKMKENLAKELIEHPEIVKIFRDLVETVPRETPVGALKHLKKVKEVWGNHRFINHLLKFEDGPWPDTEKNISSIRLSFKICSRIKEDPLFEVISVYKDPDFRMRVALSILIGFWSNQDMIRPLVYTMGGNSLGVEKKQSGQEKDESPRDWMSNTPSIMEFYSDKSIWKLADQLKEEPIAVLLAKRYLKKFKLENCQCSFLHHFEAATSFWYHPSIVLKFKEAMEKDPKLVDVLTKYSEGAETLRVQERLFHIRKELELELQATDSNDTLSTLRLALNILFSYWVDRDLTQLFQSFGYVKKKIGKDFDLCEEEEIEAFYYYANSATDVKGLNSWLARKYGEGSNKASSLAKQIGRYQELKYEEAEKCGYSDEPLLIELVKNKSSILTFSLSWLCCEGSSTLFGQCKLDEQIPLEQIPM